MEEQGKTFYCKYCMRALRKQPQRFCPLCGRDITVPPLTHQLPPGTVLNGKFELGAVLGEGGFGITYIGRDRNLDIRVAIKEFFPYGYVNRVSSASIEVTSTADETSQAFFQKGKTRFLQEARALAKFTGEPAVVAVRDFFEENGTAYIVMEYLEGKTLKQYLKEKGRLREKETLTLMTPVMRALKKLHRLNLIHRDISPDNIMLTETGVKLLDFGSAREVAEDNKSLSVLLKHGYAPFEQYQSHGNQGPWTDVYALCATMYKCVTGVRLPESTDRVLEDKMQTPAALGITLSPRFEQALLKGLAVRVNDRWQTVDELEEALTAKKAEKAPAPAEDKAEIAVPPAPPEKKAPEKAERQEESEERDLQKGLDGFYGVEKVKSEEKSAFDKEIDDVYKKRESEPLRSEKGHRSGKESIDAWLNKPIASGPVDAGANREPPEKEPAVAEKKGRSGKESIDAWLNAPHSAGSAETKSEAPVPVSEKKASVIVDYDKVRSIEDAQEKNNKINGKNICLAVVSAIFLLILIVVIVTNSSKYYVTIDGKKYQLSMTVRELTSRGWTCDESLERKSGESSSTYRNFRNGENMIWVCLKEPSNYSGNTETLIISSFAFTDSCMSAVVKTKDGIVLGSSTKSDVMSTIGAYYNSDSSSDNDLWFYDIYKSALHGFLCV